MGSVEIAILAAALAPLLMPLLFRRPFFKSILLSVLLSVAGIGGSIMLGWTDSVMPLLAVPPIAGLISLMAFSRKTPMPVDEGDEEEEEGVILKRVPDQFNSAEERPRKRIKMTPES